MDFKVQRLSLEAAGAYIHLLAFMWKDSEDQCSMPDNEHFIARILSISVRKWKKIRSEIQHSDAKLLLEECGKLVSERLREEAQKYETYREKCSIAGKVSAEKRQRPLNLCSTEGQQKGNSSSSSSSSNLKLHCPANAGRDEVPGSKKKENREVRESAKRLLEFLNSKTGCRYQPVDGTLAHIMARLRDGANERHCRAVIAMKVAEWNADPKMRKFLRPETLFNRTKFNAYYGQLNWEAESDGGSDDGTSNGDEPGVPELPRAG